MNDRSSAAPELAAIEVHGMTRAAFLMRATLSAGALAGAGAVAPFVRGAIAQTGVGDIGILNFALTLEKLETAFYERAQRLSLSSDSRSLARTFGKHEADHAESLTDMIRRLNGQTAERPRFSFDMRSERDFLRTARALEDTEVGAYNGAAPRLKSKDLLAAAGQIVQVEGRHAAAIRLAVGEEPAPKAFEKPLSRPEVLQAIAPFTDR